MPSPSSAPPPPPAPSMPPPAARHHGLSASKPWAGRRTTSSSSPTPTSPPPPAASSVRPSARPGSACMAVAVAVAVGQGTEEKLARELLPLVAALKVGPGDDPASDMGPLTTAEHRTRVVGHIQEAEHDGAAPPCRRARARPACRLRGRLLPRPDRPRRGAPRDARVARGGLRPVLCLVSCPTLAQALDLIHAPPRWQRGLALYALRCGGALLRPRGAGRDGRDQPPHPRPRRLPFFGGWKDSLFGEQHIYGEEGLRFYTRTKAITARWPEEDAEAGGAGSADGREPGPAFAMPSTA